MIKKFKYKAVEAFDIKQNGIQVIEDNEKIEIYNDVFRTVPLFITKDHDGEIIVFSNFEKYYELENIDRTIDNAGFWEIVLFGSGLWSRTLYKNVEQMPAASKIIIDKKTNQYTIERYWDFNIEEDKSIDSIEKAAQGLYNRLDSIFSKLDRDQKYVMGMSGGMDSRITLAFLSKYIPKENLELFTYGFDDRLLEYKYACEAADALGYRKPEFHKLTAKSYKNAMNYLPQVSGGQIGINHCHIMDYIQSNKIRNHLITTSYSEVVFSLLVDCESNKSELNIKRIIDSNQNLPQEIIKEIVQDYKIIKNNFKLSKQFSSISEYFYQTERHAKFHEYYSYCINLFTPTLNPFLNYELLVYVMSIPNRYKCKKMLQDYILKNYFSIQIDNISSSRFEWKDTGKDFFDWYNFKILNRVNGILRPLTKGYIQLFNKYQTEELDRLLYKNFRNDLEESTTKFVKNGLMTEEQKAHWDKLPLKSSGIGERFGLISLGKLV